MATEVQPLKKVDFYLFHQAPKPICEVQFKTHQFFKILHAIVENPVAIYCFPSYQPHLAQSETHTQFEIKFKLSESIAETIKENSTRTHLQIRFGEQLKAMSELTERLPGPVLITINSHETTATNGPINLNCRDYLYLEPVDEDTYKENVIKICWPICEKPFYMVVNIVESRTVENLVKEVQIRNKISGASLNTKAKTMEILKNFRKKAEAVYASMNLSLLCPITKLKIKLPSKSSKCIHVQCFDLHTLFSLNEVKPTWKCPVCSVPILIQELVIDSFILDIINSPSLPENCFQITLYSNGNWEPCIVEPKKEVLEDGQSETDNEYSESTTFNNSRDDFEDENLGDEKNILPKTND